MVKSNNLPLTLERTDESGQLAPRSGSTARRRTNRRRTSGMQRSRIGRYRDNLSKPDQSRSRHELKSFRRSQLYASISPRVLP